MIYVYIENQNLLRYIINILDYTNLKYVTNDLIEADKLLISQINNRTMNLVKKAKIKKIPVVFIAYLLEHDIDRYINTKRNRSLELSMKINKIKQISNKVIVSNDYYKRLFSGISSVIPYMITSNIVKYSNEFQKIMSLPKKFCLIIDKKYKYIDMTHKLIFNHPKVSFVYLGFKDQKYLSKSNKDFLNNKYKNVKYLHFYNDEFINVLSVKSKLTICLEDDDRLVNNFFINKIPFIIIKNNKYNYIYTNYKNIYLFDEKNFINIFDKVYSKKLGNITEESYKNVKYNSFDKIIDKFEQYLT